MKVKNPKAPAVKREAEEDWDRFRHLNQRERRTWFWTFGPRKAMSALPPKADINYRERDVGLVPFCSVDNLARNTARMNGHLGRPPCDQKSLICRPAASDRLHKKFIFCTKSSPLMGLYVQSR